ncbi:MAG: hypothetical protein EPO06_07040 [Burkholderiaceae bacterium]|nr:MAG: hypothetical protein EPO06_07040 [Burkholderiaceae bacterium]
MPRRTLKFLSSARDTLRAYIWLLKIQLLARKKRNERVPVAPERHIALLAWQFPPLITGGVYRPAALARYANTAGWKVSVIAGPQPAMVSEVGTFLANQIPADVRIGRPAEPQLYPSFRVFPRIDGGFLNALQAFDFGRKFLRDAPPSVLIATGPLFHNFVAGFFLARRYDVPLILEYRDEWSECPFSFVYKGNADRLWEARCLREAAAVIFTTESQRTHQLRAFPFLDPNRCHVIPNGWEQHDLNECLHGNRCERQADDPLVLSFFGNLSDHTLPGEFLWAIEKLIARKPEWRDRLRLRFVGQRSGQAYAQLMAFSDPDMLIIEEQVTKPLALSGMRESDALLIFNTPDFDRYLPGKLFDYLASGTPVLMFGEGGESAALVSQLGAGMVVPKDAIDVLDATLSTLAATRPHNDSTDLSSWLVAHTREALAGQTLDLLERLETAHSMSAVGSAQFH